ncbi:serine hydrolase [Janibacter indicus]
MRPADRVGEILRDAGCRGWVHARRVDDPEAEIRVDADEVVPIASVYKAALALVWALDADAGHLNPRQRFSLRPEGRTPGPTGLSVLEDDVDLSSRDLVRLMLTLSDNAAADHILDHLGGPERVTEALADLGHDIRVRGGTRHALARGQTDTGTPDAGAYMRALADIHRDVVTSQYDPALATSASARTLTGLLADLWGPTLVPGPHGDVVREAMTRQAWSHRLRSGLPHDDVVVAGKTGTLGTLRHEIGVVTFPGEVPIAVAVLTRSARPEQHLPIVDAAIGQVAASVVHPLRTTLGR